MNTDRYQRQILAFGEEGQRKIEAIHVGIVGLGGIGSQVVQALAYLGVGSFVLIDDDLLDETNLNRLVGGVPSDVPSKASKTYLAERQIRQINPRATVNSIQDNLRSRQALEALISCPVIFSCVDHDGPRLILMEMAAAYEITLIDSATEIILNNGRLIDYGGRVVISRPGDYCLSCAHQIDMEQAKWELQTTAEKQVREKHGYGLGEQGPAPAVISLNGVVANLAVSEFLAMITEIREPNRHLTYKAFEGHVNRRTDKRSDDCFTCGYLAGKYEKANIFRYVQEEK